MNNVYEQHNMFLGGITVLVSEIGYDFLDGFRSMRSRARRLKRLVSKVIVVVKYHCIVRYLSY